MEPKEEETEDTGKIAMPAELLEIIEKIAEVEALSEPFLEMLDHVVEKGMGKKLGEAIKLVVNEVLVEPFKPLFDQLDTHMKNSRKERLEFIKTATANSKVSEATALALVQYSDLERRFIGEQIKGEIWKLRAQASEGKGGKSSKPSSDFLEDLLKKARHN